MVAVVHSAAPLQQSSPTGGPWAARNLFAGQDDRPDAPVKRCRAGDRRYPFTDRDQNVGDNRA